ncbi:MAG: hypothetical protein KDE08_03675 [Rhodobacteraceae bacterium]|nr:hypothetical protein [Paracoccaceae bacterium]
MEKIATTIRIDAHLKAGLEKLGELRHATLNALVNQAIGDFVVRESSALEAEMLASIAELRRYRQADPNFDASLAAFADAEASYGGEDPVEGTIVTAPDQGLSAQLRDILGG